MKIPFLSLILQGIPEQIALVTLAFILARINLEWKKIVAFGVILAFVAYVLRLFPITFGIHTIILIGLLFVFLNQFCHVPLLVSLKASLISYLVLITIEFVFFTSLMALFGMSFEKYLTDVPIRILLGLPQVFILFILAFIILKVKQERK